MEVKVIFLGLVSAMMFIIAFISNKLGASKEKERQLKEELERNNKEQEYVQQTAANIHVLSAADVNDKLQKLAGKK